MHVHCLTFIPRPKNKKNQSPSKFFLTSNANKKTKCTNNWGLLKEVYSQSYYNRIYVLFTFVIHITAYAVERILNNFT